MILRDRKHTLFKRLCEKKSYNLFDFHTTSKKCSNQGVVNTSEFLLSSGITKAKHLYLNKLSVRKGSHNFL